MLSHEIGDAMSSFNENAALRHGEASPQPGRFRPTERCSIMAFGGRRQLSVTDSDSPHMVAARVAELLPGDPHRPVGRCFQDFWSWQKVGRAKLAPKQWERAWRTHLLKSTPPTGSPPIGEVEEHVDLSSAGR